MSAAAVLLAGLLVGGVPTVPAHPGVPTICRVSTLGCITPPQRQTLPASQIAVPPPSFPKRVQRMRA